MSQIYEDGTYLENNPLWHEPDSLWKAKQILKIIEKNKLSPSTICEIGCGAGGIITNLSTELGDKNRFFGYDISPQAIMLCQNKKKHNLIFRQQDLLEDSTAYFDLLLIIDVFEHVEDYFGFLRKSKEKAEYKIFHIPLDLSVQWVLRASPIVNIRSKAGHLHFFTKETALEALKDTGYEILDWFYTAGSVQLKNRGWKADLLKIPRKIAYLLNQDLAARVLGGYSLLVLAK